MKFLDILGLVAGLCTSSSILPQIIKTVKTKQTEDVSIFMFIVMFTGNSLWVYYGIQKSDIAIIATNILAMALNIIMFVLNYRYKAKQQSA